MNTTLDNISQQIADLSDAICGYPEFFLLIGGGLILFILSKGISIRHLPQGIKALRDKQATDSGKQTGQISSVQALLSAIAATVGMGNIAGVAIALSVGGPGVIFWMWVSALLGMTTKFFEGALSIMYKGEDEQGNPQGGPMYIITQGLGPKWRWLAVAFSIFGLVGTLCFMQANQLVESVTTVFTTPMGIENTAWLRFGMGVVMALIVGGVIMGGIGRIAKWASRLVPIMVVAYLAFVLIITVMNYDAVPHIFKQIFAEAFTLDAGVGAFFFIALTGARRAAMVNEAGVGTASMMHGASKNTDPIREGLIAMLGPAIDSGLVCTLTSIPIIIAGNYVGVYILHLGVAGVAWPSFLSRTVSAVILFIMAMNQKNPIYITPSRIIRWEGNIVRQIVKIAVPNGIENGLFQLGRILVASIAASYGTTLIAANGVANSIYTLLIICGSALNIGVVTVVGQCVGAGDFDQARYYTRKFLLLVTGLQVANGIAVWLMLPVLLHFYSISAAGAALVRRIILMSLFTLTGLNAISFTLPNAIRAAGDAKYTMVVGILSMFLVRITGSYLLGTVAGLHVIGLFLAMYLDWAARAICFVHRYRSGKWTKYRLV